MKLEEEFFCDKQLNIDVPVVASLKILLFVTQYKLQKMLQLISIAALNKA
jgi:hypothetical protein